MRSTSVLLLAALAFGGSAWAGCSVPETMSSESGLTEGRDGDAKTAKKRPKAPKPGLEGPELAPPPLTPSSPRLESLEPRSIRAASESVELVLRGSQFDASAKVSFDGADLPATSTSANEIRILVPAERLVNAASIPIKVHNPPNSGGGSNLLSFTVASEPTRIVLEAVSPVQVPAGSADLEVTASGSGFGRQAKLRFNGADLTTTYASGTTLTAKVPAAMLRLAGSVSVAVYDPSGSALSEPQVFVIEKPADACGQSCADFGYSRGQCHQDWTCGEDGCLEAKACPAPCDYKCSDYDYGPTECFADWKCKNGCLVAAACGGGSSSSGSSGSATGCTWPCVDPDGKYAYTAGQCSGGYCCRDGCLVDDTTKKP